MRRAAAVLAVAVLLAVPALSQGKLGVGGSFMEPYLRFDAFAEWGLADFMMARLSAGIGSVRIPYPYYYDYYDYTNPYYEVSFITADVTVLGRGDLGDTQLFFGGGGGVCMLDLGIVMLRMPMAIGTVGLTLPIFDWGGAYIQARYYKMFAGREIIGVPSVGGGVYINF